MASSSNRKWKDFTEEEKNRILENNRRNRRRWKEEDAEIEALYESNEKRIRDLEKACDQLSKELATDSRPSGTSKSKSKSKSNNQNKQG